MTRENWKKNHWSTGGDEARSRPTMVDLGVLRIELKGTPWVLLELKGVQRKLRSQLRGAQVTERERVQRHTPPRSKRCHCHPERRELVKGVEGVDFEGGRTTRIKCRSE